MKSIWMSGFMIVVTVLLLAACSQVEKPEIAFELAAVSQSSNVYDFGCNPCDVVLGTSSLKRNNSGVTLNLHTSDLSPGDAVTLWGIIFNNPDACSDTCGEDDLLPFNEDADPDVMGSALRVAGHVVDNSGEGGFSGRIKIADTSEILFGPGLLYPQSAEIHAVVRTHGPAIPGLVNEQIHSYSGGCEINECVDFQFAIHLP